MNIDPEEGFTSDVIRDPKRFVGREDLLKSKRPSEDLS